MLGEVHDEPLRSGAAVRPNLIDGERVGRQRRDRLIDRPWPRNRCRVRIDRLTDLDAAAVDGEVRERIAAGVAVGEVDDGVHGTVDIGVVGTREMDGETVMKGDRARRHFQKDRFDVFDLGLAQNVLGLTEEDVHELAHADLRGCRVDTRAHRCRASTARTGSRP